MGGEVQTYGKLRSLDGPMFCGKTSRLVNIINDLCFSRKPYIVISHIADKQRHEEMNLRASHDDYLISHSGAKVRATMFSDLDEVDRERCLEDGVRAVVIDEIQFFPKASAIAFIEWARLNGMDVYTAGLSSDFTGTPFPICSWLYVNAKIQRMRGTCALCSRPSVYSHLRNTSDSSAASGNIVVGGADKYQPLCQPCFKEQCPEYYAKSVAE